MEKEFKGTRGKWKREDTADYAMIKSDGNDVPVALVANSDDANLIAAAPELLQACMADVVNDYNADGAFIGCKVVGLSNDVLGKFTDIDIAFDFIEQLKQSAINSALNIK